MIQMDLLNKIMFVFISIGFCIIIALIFYDAGYKEEQIKKITRLIK